MFYLLTSILVLSGWKTPDFTVSHHKTKLSSLSLRIHSVFTSHNFIIFKVNPLLLTYVTGTWFVPFKIELHAHESMLLSFQVCVKWWSAPTGRRGAGRTSGTAWPSRTSGSWSWRPSWRWLRRWPTTASARRGERRPLGRLSARTSSRELRLWEPVQRPREEEGSWGSHWSHEGSSPSSGQHPLDPPIGHLREEVRGTRLMLRFIIIMCSELSYYL